MDGARLVTWGNRLLAWTLPGGEMRVLMAGNSEGFGRAGCLMDVDRDGLLDFVAQQGDRLVWRRAPGWTAHTIDTGIDTPDVLPAVFDGRRGVLIVQKYMQVRFYQAARKGAWPVRDVYSFYTPSHEAGLLLDDVDGDGQPDILCGNYWIRNPGRFELPWRLFAINTYNEGPWSAAARLALADVSGRDSKDLVFSEAEVNDARLAWFERPSDPKLRWIEHRLEGGLRLNRPRALAAADLNGDGRADLAVGENSGTASRLFVFWNRGGGEFDPEQLASGTALHTLFVTDVNRDGRPDLVAVGPDSITWWENAGTRRRPAASPPAAAKTGR